MSQSSTIVQRLWNYCNVLRADDFSYGDYLEQLTYLLFLKMDDEQVQELDLPSSIPVELGCQPDLVGWRRSEAYYRHILTELGKGSGLIPLIFRKA